MKTDVVTQELLDAGRALFHTRRGPHEPYAAYLGARCNAHTTQIGAIIGNHLQVLAYRDCVAKTPFIGGKALLAGKGYAPRTDSI